ncbi:ankyrin repeat domain-containing protein 27-like [Eriocheir sinensis]|uniref:ankyrin repeat domain-containing protein 27-like n=1 Tax=Eriocheir sinensis TaxID=95602 RepID=UPI0021C6D8F5|nr:ankyrin repeat domain-containing protein 27-like [Eriocheir sinensis]XP_050694032.1 ankyrin repeat domain-containing protein 27-like [Eriocheir sinensis]
MEDYDEDLGANVFFCAVRDHHRGVLQRAAAGGWLLCVPRAAAAPPPPLDQAVLEAHVLVPCPEAPDSSFRTLGGRGVEVQAAALVLGEGPAGGAPRRVRVLFTETFYDEALGRYKAVCVEEALHGAPTVPPLPQLASLRECVELLWAQAGGSAGLARLDALLAGFLAAHPQLEEEEEGTGLRDLVGELYCEALQVVLGEGAGQGEAGGVLGLAVESYLMHALHAKLIRCLASYRAEEDARFNRALRGLSDLQPSDLGLGPELAGGLVRATLELSGLGGHTTPLGKLGCLKRAVVQLGREAGPVSSDQLLPALVVVVVRTGLPTWPAQLAFLRLFRFSAPAGGGGEHDFYLSSLEAALQHIASGALLGPPCPEADSVLRPDPGPQEAMTTGAVEEAGRDPCARYFECVRLGLVEEVEALLDGQGRPPRDEGAMEDKKAQLCHPLCHCERCEALMHQPQEDPWPTVAMEDPLGRTAMHLACIFGRPALVDLMVARSADLEAKDQRGATPLHHAALRGHQNALLLLLHAGADINSLDGEQNTALHLAAVQGHPACVKALLFYAESVGRHLEVNSQNTALDTPLHLASRWGYLAIVEQLLDRLVALGLPLNVANRRRLTPIECAHNQPIVRAILAARARATGQGTAGKPRAKLVAAMAPTPPGTHLGGTARALQGRRPPGVNRAASVEKMLKAVRVGDERLACFYLGIEDCGPAPATSTTVLQHSPAPAAPATVTQDSPALCHPLCQCVKCVARAPRGQGGGRGAAHGVAINTCDSQGRTALHEAVTAGHEGLAGLLLRYGADPNAQTLDQGLSPLHLAARGGTPQMVAELAQYGANLDLQDTLGNTALHLSCAAGQSETMRELLRLGAARGMANLAGRSPTQEAEEHGHWRLVEILLGKAAPQ